MSAGADPNRSVRINALRSNITRVIRGKDEVVDMLLMALLSGGSVLLEDAPGVGKTTLAKALAASVAASFNRIQFTPDLLPGDILGSSIYNPVQGTFVFRQGPVFCNILLADEINRSSPRTQSALLEGDERRSGHNRGATPPARSAVLGARHTEFRRVSRHLSLARSAVGPVSYATVAGLPGAIH